MSKPKKVGILLFNQVEVLDFAGPFEVFSIATQRDMRTKLFSVQLVAEKMEPITARNGLQVLPQTTTEAVGELDILIVPGGDGADKIEIHNQRLLQWIARQAGQVEVLASVCTGAFLLAEAGLLNGLQATTHWMDTAGLQRKYLQVQVLVGRKFVDNGQIVTSAGISAGIEMSLHLVRRCFGPEVARLTALHMEYDWMESDR